MKLNDKKLEILSNEVKKSIEQLHVVTPTIYRSIFDEYAKNNDIQIEDEDDISKDVLSTECSRLTSLQDQTYKNANTLSQNTSDAISAIEDKDDDKLNQILFETKQLREEVDKLKESLYKDQLTNAYNRKWVHDKCLQESTNAFLSSGILALIDLNYFKAINDTHGHILGDKVLIFITNELRKLGLPVIRYGGDEFIVLFNNKTDEEKALQALNKLRENIIKKKLKAHETTFTVSFSFGITSFHEGALLENVIETADQKMYHDKLEIKKRVTGI